MGLGSWLLNGTWSLPDQIASPFASSEGVLSKVTAVDLFGAELADTLPMTRSEALSIPAVSKAHNLITSTIARFPLYAYQGELELVDQPAFLYRSDSGVSPYERMSRTVSDIFFEGKALWTVTRGTAGQIIDAQWCPLNQWRITEGQILVNDRVVDEADVILFWPNFDGLLNVGARTLRQARDIENTVSAKTRNPIPLIALSSDDYLDDEEITDLIAQWSKARRDVNGAVGFVPKGITLTTEGVIDPELYEGARNALRTDIGSFVNTRASMLDGTAGVESLTYKTSEGEKNSFFELDLPFFYDPIAARLSLDDVVPRGTSVRFKLYQSAPVLTGIPTED